MSWIDDVFHDTHVDEQHVKAPASFVKPSNFYQSMSAGVAKKKSTINVRTRRELILQGNRAAYEGILRNAASNLYRHHSDLLVYAAAGLLFAPEDKLKSLVGAASVDTSRAKAYKFEHASASEAEAKPEKADKDSRPPVDLSFDEFILGTNGLDDAYNDAWAARIRKSASFDDGSLLPTEHNELLRQKLRLETIAEANKAMGY